MYIYVAKTNVLISCVITAQLICPLCFSILYETAGFLMIRAHLAATEVSTRLYAISNMKPDLGLCCCI